MSIIEAPVTTELEQRLLRTLHRIEEYGWAHGSWPNTGGWYYELPSSNCLYISFLAGNGLSDSDNLADDAAELANALGFSGISELYAWNDAPGRTKAEVIQRLREAVAKVRA